MKVDPISSTWPPLPPPPDHHRVILCHSSSFNGGLQWWMTCSAVLRRDDSPQDQVVVTASILLQQSKASLVFDPDLTKPWLPESTVGIISLFGSAHLIGIGLSIECIFMDRRRDERSKKRY